MTKYSNEELLDGILHNNSIILKHIYKSHHGKINAFICKNSGDRSDANDVFQEAIIVIYRKLKSDGLELKNCSFTTYLYSTCRLLWLKQLQDKKKDIVDIRDIHSYSRTVIDDGIEELASRNERYKLYQDHFKELGKECQDILQLFFDKVPFKQIAETLGLASENYAKKRKHQCKEHLVRSIKQDIEYKNIIEDDY